MSNILKILLFFVLPAIGPSLLIKNLMDLGWLAVVVIASVFVILGVFLWRGNSTALTLSIFLQGLNVIIGLMAFLPNLSFQGQIDLQWMLISLSCMALSMYLLLRLDKTDVRVNMVT